MDLVLRNASSGAPGFAHATRRLLAYFKISDRLPLLLLIHFAEAFVLLTLRIRIGLRMVLGRSEMRLMRSSLAQTSVCLTEPGRFRFIVVFSIRPTALPMPGGTALPTCLYC